MDVLECLECTRNGGAVCERRVSDKGTEREQGKEMQLNEHAAFLREKKKKQ